MAVRGRAHHQDHGRSPGGTIAVTYRGDTGAYTVKGGTGVQGGEIYYFDRTFIMKKGSITFNEDQANFDPWITARAEVREWDPTTGTEVKIFLDADSSFSKFSPRFSSDPPRLDTDILAMIGAPLVNRVETQGVGMAALGLLRHPEPEPDPSAVRAESPPGPEP